MKLDVHVAATLKELGIEAEEIHRWIDEHFDRNAYERARFTGVPGFNPYAHRIHRHCHEAEDECVEAFSELYEETIIRSVFECHIRLDYNGEYPSRNDFSNADFLKRHHSH